MDCDSNDSNSHPTYFDIVKFPQFSFSMHAGTPCQNMVTILNKLAIIFPKLGRNSRLVAAKNHFQGRSFMTNLSMALFQFSQAKIFNVSNEKVACSHAEIWATTNGLVCRV